MTYSNPKLVVNLSISCMALEKVLAKARVYNSIRTAILPSLCASDRFAPLLCSRNEFTPAQSLRD